MSVRAQPADGSEDAGIREAAARWMVRKDRTLTPAEAHDFEVWLATDPRHAAAIARATQVWQAARTVGVAVRELRDREPAVRKTRVSWTTVSLLAAAAIGFGAFMFPSAQVRVDAPRVASIAPAGEPASRTRTLDDGTIVSLRGDAEIEVRFSEVERHVRLLRGESYFAVTPNRERPFVVEAGGTRVRVVGTAFAVRFAPEAVNILVTEGAVQVDPSKSAVGVTPSSPPRADSEVVTAGHRAVVRQAGNASRITIAAASRAEIDRELAWNEPMLELAGGTLGDLAARFSRATGRRIEMDPSLAFVRLGGQMPASDIEGFVRAIETIYPVKSEWREDGSILLRSAR